MKHVESRELFALKRIRKDRVIERSEVERAFMERDILSFVQNPFVVSMLCSFQVIALRILERFSRCYTLL